MPKMIFVNLPVSDVSRATAFYEAVGATKVERFSDETAACMQVSDAIHVMLLREDKFRQFTPKAIADARATTEVLLCLSEESRESVDARVEAAAAAGGKADPGLKMDHETMYGRSYEDPDGHIWEVMWMDPEQAAKGCPEATATAETREAASA